MATVRHEVRTEMATLQQLLARELGSDDGGTRTRSSTPTSGLEPGTRNPKPYVWTKTADESL